MKLEKDIERVCVSIAEKRGWLSFKLTSLRSGLPDRIFMKKGKVFFAEFKKNNGVLSKIQIVTISQIRKADVDVVVIKSISVFEGVLDEYDIEKVSKRS